jgi:hypothetical protein
MLFYFDFILDSLGYIFGKYFNIFLIPLLFLSIFQCQSNSSVLSKEQKPVDPLDSEKIPVVFVPGIKGSVLVDAKGEVQWLTGLQALGLDTSDLRLYASNNQRRELQGAGALARVTAIPYLLDVNIYDGWLKRISGQKDIDMHVFSYDWRQDNNKTSLQLESFIKNISLQYKRKPILVGHSMGGMLSLSVTNRNPEIVSKIIFVGVPFRGGIGYMEDLYKGLATGLNSGIQAPCVIARYESVYGFFPGVNSWDTKGVLLDEKGQEMQIDFFRVEDWKKNQLGFYGISCPEKDVPSSEEFSKILEMAKNFRKSLDPSPGFLKNPPPVLVVTSNKRQTLVKIQLVPSGESNHFPYKWDFNKAPKENGDGRVSEANSLPPFGFPYKKIYTDNEHSTLLNDINIQNNIIEFIKSK